MGKAIMGSHNSAVTAVGINSTVYFPVSGVNSYSNTESDSHAPMDLAGTMSGLMVNIRTNGLTLATATFTFRKNGANGNQTISVGAGVTGILSDTTNSDSISAADTVSVVLVTSNLGIGTIAPYTTKLNFSASSGHSVFNAVSLPSYLAFASASSTRTFPFFGDLLNLAPETPPTMHVGGTFSKFEVNIPANARTTTTTFRVRKNSANGNGIISVSAGSTGILKDTSNSDSYSDGDTMGASMTTGTGTETISIAMIGVQNTSSGAGINAFGGRYGSISSRGASGTRAFACPIGRVNTYNTANEGSFDIILGFAATLSKASLQIASNSYTGTATYNIRINNANGNQTIAIPAGTTGVFTDTTNTDVVTATDKINHSIIDGTSGSHQTRYHSLVITPKSSGVANSLMLMGVGI